MKIENMLQRFSCISFLFKPPWSIKVAMLCEKLLLLLPLGDYPHLGVHSMNLYLLMTIYHDLFVLSLWLSLAFSKVFP